MMCQKGGFPRQRGGTQRMQQAVSPRSSALRSGAQRLPAIAPASGTGAAHRPALNRLSGRTHDTHGTKLVGNGA